MSQLRDRWRRKSPVVVTQPLQRGRRIGAGATPAAGTIVAMVAHVHFVSGVIAAAAVLGLVVAWSQLAALWKHLRRPPAVPTRRPAI